VPIVEANVGVTLIVDNNRIAAVDRQEEGITFGEITVPVGKVQVEERDSVEQACLELREERMQLVTQRPCRN